MPALGFLDCGGWCLGESSQVCGLGGVIDGTGKIVVNRITQVFIYLALCTVPVSRCWVEHQNPIKNVHFALFFNIKFEPYGVSVN